MLWSMLRPNGSFLVLPRKVKQTNTNDKNISKQLLQKVRHLLINCKSSGYYS